MKLDLDELERLLAEATTSRDFEDREAAAMKLLEFVLFHGDALVRIARAAQTLAWFDPESEDRGAKSWDELYDALRAAGLLGEDEG